MAPAFDASRHEWALWDLFVFEPWFLIEGVLFIAAGAAASPDHAGPETLDGRVPCGHRHRNVDRPARATRLRRGFHEVYHRLMDRRVRDHVIVLDQEHSVPGGTGPCTLCESTRRPRPRTRPDRTFQLAATRRLSGPTRRLRGAGELSVMALELDRGSIWCVPVGAGPAARHDRGRDRARLVDRRRSQGPGAVGHARVGRTSRRHGRPAARTVVGRRPTRRSDQRVAGPDRRAAEAARAATWSFDIRRGIDWRWRPTTSTSIGSRDSFTRGEMPASTVTIGGR